MAVFQILREPEITQRIVDLTVARTARLNDLTPASDLYQVARATGRTAEALYFELGRLIKLRSLFDARGADLDALALEVLPTAMLRLTASRAIGTLRWTRAVAGASAIIIPAGTRVARPGSSPQAAYVTTAPGQIPALGTQSVRTDGPGGDIPARAETLGAAGNSAISTVTKPLTTIAGANAVTNPQPFTGGRDQEGDDAFRGRIISRTQNLARCTPPALEARALEADLDGHRVTSARHIQTPWQVASATIYIDDGSGHAESFATTGAAEDLCSDATGGETRFTFDHRPLRQDNWTVTLDDGSPAVLVNGTDYKVDPALGILVLSPTLYPSGLAANDVLTVAPYQYWTGLIAEAQRLISGDPEDPVNFPAYYGAGVMIRVRTPSVRWQIVTATIAVRDGFTREAVAAFVAQVIAAYINGLNIGDDVIRNELIERAMGVEGMFDIGLTLPISNQPVADFEVARIASSNLDVS